MSRFPRPFAAPVLAILTILSGSTGCLRSAREKEAQFLRKGQEYRDKRDFARALLQFKNAMVAQPKDAEPLYQLGLTYLGMQDVRDAATYLKKATELNPKHAKAQLNLAILLANYGDKQLLSDAQTRMQELVKDQPDNTDAIDALALTEFKLGKPEEAEKNLEAALTRSSANLKSSAELAQIKEILKDPAGAEAVLKNAVASAPGSSEPLLLLGQFYVRQNRFAEAEEQARRALQINPNSAVALAFLGVVQDRQGAREKAESSLKQVSLMGNQSLQPMYGLLLMQHGKTEEALGEFKRLALKDPSDRKARSRLVSAYVATNHSDEAEHLLVEAIKKNGKDADALLQLSSLDLLEGKLNDAQTNLLELLHIGANLAPAHYQLAQVYQRRGHELLYLQELGETLRLDPKLLAARLELARALTRAHNSQSALATLDEAPNSQKSTLGWRLARNQALYADHDYAALGRELDKMPASGNPAILMQEASLRYAQQDYAGARASVERVLRDHPEDPRAINALAQTWAAQGEQAKALQIVRDFARKHADSPIVQHLLVSWLIRVGKPQEARATLAALVGKHPDFAPAALLSARFDFADKNYDAVCRTLRALLSASPSNVDARVMLAQAEDASGNESAAIQDYRTLLKYDNSNWIALNDLAYMLVDSNPEEALQYAQAALARQPENPVVLDTAGWVFLHNEMYLRAVAELEQAVTKDGTAVSKYHLALAYMKAGQRERGKQMLQAALAMDPDLAKTQQRDWGLWGELAK